MHLVGFIIRIYHDARSAEGQKCGMKELGMYLPGLAGIGRAVSRKVPKNAGDIFTEKLLPSKR